MLLGIFAGLPCGCAGHRDPGPADVWQTLFDGESLDGWKPSLYGGQGDVRVEEDRIVFHLGQDLTGITREDGEKLPRSNYEIELEAMRIAGTDFFCGLTFPVNDDHMTLIVGGWGGPLVGLSSIDGRDASENETTVLKRFETERWYRIRLRVKPERVRVWIDDERLIDVDIAGREIGIRPEVSPSRPLGIAAWNTTAAVRDIRLRQLGE